MKIIHTADIHLDSKLESNLGKERAAARRAEILETFMAMIDYAAENSVEAILISGDLFDVKKISATVRNRVLSGIRNNPQILFYYLKGNHDINSFLEGIEDVPSNLYTFNDKWTSYFIGKKGSVCISGIEINSENSNSLYDSLFLDFDKVNIVMLHGQQAGYASKDKTEIISLSSLKNRNIDYLALGHIHSYREEAIDGRGTMVYPGCLDPRGFDECSDHGFVLLDIDEESKTYRHEFVSFASRRGYEVKVDVTGIMDTAEVIAGIEDEIRRLKIRNKDFIWIILDGETDVENQIDELAIEKRFENTFWMVKVSNQTGTKVNYESYLLDKTLKGAFVRMVMEQTDLSEDEKAQIVACGLAAIRDEEIELCD